MMIRQGKGKKDRDDPDRRAGAGVDRPVPAYRVRPELVVGRGNATLFLTATGEPFTPNRLTQLVRDYVNAAQTRQERLLPPVPPHDGDPDAGERRGHPLHPGDARARGALHHADLHPGVDPQAQGNPHRDAPGKSAHGGRAAPRRRRMTAPTAQDVLATLAAEAVEDEGTDGLGE